MSQAPVNPAFERYQATHQKTTMRAVSAGGHALGYVPAPVNFQGATGQKLLLSQSLDELPSSYDLRDYGKVTPVKDQGNCGSCWTFGTFASLESYLLIGETNDFSENNLKNNHGFNYGPCDGGNVTMSTAYLSQWSGPATEAADPYHDWDDLPDPIDSPVKHVQEVLFLPMRTDATDNDIVKQAIMTYGAVTMSFFYGDSYYNGVTHAYYYDGTNDANHEVAIVGWDDNYDRINFATAPSENGAFIVKNSWGTGWGEAGYFYMSYYDTQVGMNTNGSTDLAVLENAESTANYSNVYQYDPLGWVGSIGYSNTTAWLANVFTATGAEQLRAVSFYTASADSSYEIYVYRNPPTGTPIGGSSVSSTNGTITYPGYHTVALSTPVLLTDGQTFSVVIKLTTPDYNWPIPIEYAKPGYSSGATVSAGQSYISPNGTAWEDGTTAWSYPFNVCIKAFTMSTLTITKMQMKWTLAKTNSDSCTLTATISDLDSGYNLTSKLVTLDVGGAQLPFTLDARGKGRGIGTFGSCKLTYKKKQQIWELTAKLAKGSWQGLWEKYGLVNNNVPKKPTTVVTVPVVMVIDAASCAGVQSMGYTAKRFRSGTAK